VYGFFAALLCGHIVERSASYANSYAKEKSGVASKKGKKWWLVNTIDFITRVLRNVLFNDVTVRCAQTRMSSENPTVINISTSEELDKYVTTSARYVQLLLITIKSVRYLEIDQYCV